MAVNSTERHAMDLLSGAFGSLAITPPPPPQQPSLYLYVDTNVITKHILPNVTLAGVCSFGQADKKSCKLAIEEVRRRGFTFANQANLTDCKAAWHMCRLESAVKQGQKMLLEAIRSQDTKQVFASCTTLEEAVDKTKAIAEINKLIFRVQRNNNPLPMILPPEIGQFTSVTIINAIGCKIVMVSPSIGKCRQLTHLSLVHQKLTELPANIRECTNLIRLDLRENPLSSLPKELNECKALKELWLQDTKIAGDETSRAAIKASLPLVNPVFEDDTSESDSNSD